MKADLNRRYQRVQSMPPRSQAFLFFLIFQPSIIPAPPLSHAELGAANAELTKRTLP